jgi:hypothetical protein
MSLSSLSAPMPVSFREAARAWKTRVPRRVKLLLAAALLLFAAAQLWVSISSPAEAIRSSLTAAAADTASLPWTASPDAVRDAIGAHFPGQDVTVDPSRFPVEVSVALPAVDRVTCLEARKLVRRIEGTVVVALDGYRSAADCSARNSMTWRIMP